jgi:hypothetical protein
VSVTASPGQAVEGGTDGGFVFSRTGDHTNSLPINFSTAGTAMSGTDYSSLGSVVIPAGQSSVTVPVHALADSPTDSGENVIVQLASSNVYNLGSPNSATVDIVEGACANAKPAPYTDRNTFDVFANDIDCMTGYGLAQGFADNTFRPTLNVSRAEMASFVARLVAKAGVTLPSNPPDMFTDDEIGPPHELAIDQLGALGIWDGTTGEQGSSYGPSDPMRRDDMAQILVNAYKLITGSSLAAGTPGTFTDVSNGGDPHGTGTDNADAINALAKAGVVTGKTPTTYEPASPVSRGEFAGFFARYLQLLVNTGKLTPLP